MSFGITKLLYSVVLISSLNFSSSTNNDTYNMSLDIVDNLTPRHEQVLENLELPISDYQKEVLYSYLDLNSNVSEFNPAKYQAYYNEYTKNEYFKNCGFQDMVLQWEANNREYDWYIDQGDTGKARLYNCGPAVATMAVKWFNKDFTGSGEDARNTYPELEGKWWTTNAIRYYLDKNNVPNRYTDYQFNREQIKSIIDNGDIIILTVNTNELPTSIDDKHIGRFYASSTGHFIIVKGYVETINDFYLETYDSNSLGLKYNDGNYKGIDRYYLLEDVNKGVKDTWNFMIVVSEK